MKRFAGSVAMVAILTLAPTIPAWANADAGQGGLTNAIGTSQGGANMTTTQYKSTYTDPLFGPVSCSGVHQVGKNTSALGQDSFTCSSTTGAPITNPDVLATIAANPGGGYWWQSDFYVLQGESVRAVTFTYTLSPDGLSYSVVATY